MPSLRISSHCVTRQRELYGALSAPWAALSWQETLADFLVKPEEGPLDPALAVFLPVDTIDPVLELLDGKRRS